MNKFLWLASKALDALAGFGTGVSVLLIAIGVKELPSLFDHTLLREPWAAYLWIGLLILSSVLVIAGAILRTQKSVDRGFTIPTGLEYVGWIGIAGCVIIFGIATFSAFGLIDGLTTIGFTVALSALALGQWLRIHRRLRERSELTANVSAKLFRLQSSPLREDTDESFVTGDNVNGNTDKG